MKRWGFEAEAANIRHSDDPNSSGYLTGADQLLQTVGLHEIGAWVVVRGTIGIARPIMMRASWMGRIVAIMAAGMPLLMRTYA